MLTKTSKIAWRCNKASILANKSSVNVHQKYLNIVFTSNNMRFMSSNNMMTYMPMRFMSDKKQKVVFSVSGVTEDQKVQPSVHITSQKPDFPIHNGKVEKASGSVNQSKGEPKRYMKQSKEEYVKDVKKMYEYQRDRWIHNASKRSDENLYEDQIQQVSKKLSGKKDFKWLEKADKHAEAEQDVLAALINHRSSKGKFITSLISNYS
jgi:hypothetical protein